MKRLLLLSLAVILLCLPTDLYARGACAAAAGGGGAVVCASYTSQASDSDYEYLGDADGNRYVGTDYTPPANVCVCKVVFKLGATGTITGKTFYAEIWNTTGSYPDVVLSGSAIGTSAGVTGGAWGTGTAVTFTFSPCINLTSGTQYAITASDHETDSSNYSRMRYYTTSDTWSYGTGMYRWSTTGSKSGRYNYDPYIEVWAQ